jgi:hypothetical protein
LVKQRNFPGFYPEVKTLKESQDNVCSGRDSESLRKLVDDFLLGESGFDPNPGQVGIKMQKKSVTGTIFNQNTSLSSGTIISSVHTSHSLISVKELINNRSTGSLLHNLF